MIGRWCIPLEGSRSAHADYFDEQISDTLGILSLGLAEDTERDQADEHTNTHKSSESSELKKEVQL